MRLHDWAFLTATVAAVFFVVAAFLGQGLWAAFAATFVVASVIAARNWSRKYPGPMPTAFRWVLFLVPHGVHYLKKALRPCGGEHLLEIGPGVGHHALAIAPLLRPNGVLEVVDIQQMMLDRVMRRAAAAGIANIVPTRADARYLPYSDSTFDAVYLSAVLGECGDQRAVLSEIRRVLKPRGRLVVAEVLLDPDYVPLSRLREMAQGVGLDFDYKLGLAFAYLGRFRASRS